MFEYYELKPIIRTRGTKMISEKLEPKKVFEIFEQIASIPHGSYNIDAISDWIVSFAKDHDLKYIQDADKNVIVIRDASAGYEDVPTLMLQGHIDMVCAKDQGVEFDFTKDPLDLYIDGDFLKARGTTLGADDGVFVAYALAILTDPDIKLGKIEGVFTVNEEVGLLGAASIDENNLTGKYMINIDSCEENSIIVSCAGGQDAEIQIAYNTEECLEPVYKIDISGLSGGHSGEQINQGLANANKVLIQVLSEINNSFDLKLSKLEGGVADNVIPSHAEALIHLSESQYNIVSDLIKSLNTSLKNEYKNTDGNIQISLFPSNEAAISVFEKDAVNKILIFVNTAPNGVVKMSEDIEGLVETSLNLGIISTEEDYVSFIYSMRSSIDSDKQALFDKLTDIAVSCDAVVENLGGYPGWEFKKESVLRPIFEKVFENTYNKKLKVEAIHAGLECGIFAGKINNLDCVSMGPDVFDLHTTTERLSISSAKRTYEFLINVLKCFSEEMKDKRG